jgi:hypothetical protein
MLAHHARRYRGIEDQCAIPSANRSKRIANQEGIDVSDVEDFAYGNETRIDRTVMCDTNHDMRSLHMLISLAKNSSRYI